MLVSNMECINFASYDKKSLRNYYLGTPTSKPRIASNHVPKRQQYS